MNSENHIQISNLYTGYLNGKKTKVIAKELNASTGKGSLICLLGANGTGKSTLLRTLCGFQPLISGDVFLMGKPINKMTEKDISRILSVVLTERIAVPNATIYELVSYGRSPYTRLLGKLTNNDKKVVDDAINQCGIAHKKYELLSSLSDGERQKAFIAKALAQDTPIILLDEPTAFLDLSARIEIIQLMRKVVTESGKTVILSTHDLDLALQMADKLWLLQPNGSFEQGSPEDLLLKDAFQKMFNGSDIVFDTKTGLFRVNYKYLKEITVKGHGFEYVLLRRAFARNGVKITPHNEENSDWIEIEKNGDMVFKLYKNKELIYSEKSVEQIVNHTLNCLN